MGVGFEQANRGEAGLRRLGWEALQNNRHIDEIMTQTDIPDYPVEI